MRKRKKKKKNQFKKIVACTPEKSPALKKMLYPALLVETVKVKHLTKWPLTTQDRKLQKLVIES